MIAANGSLPRKHEKIETTEKEIQKFGPILILCFRG
jgi:hypothetical protein